MESGFNVAMIAIVFTAWISHAITIARYDLLVEELPNQTNYQVCEQLGSRLASFDRITCTCDNGFQFDLIKEGE